MRRFGRVVEVDAQLEWAQTRFQSGVAAEKRRCLARKGEPYVQKLRDHDRLCGARPQTGGELFGVNLDDDARKIRRAIRRIVSGRKPGALARVPVAREVLSADLSSPPREHQEDEREAGEQRPARHCEFESPLRCTRLAFTSSEQLSALGEKFVLNNGQRRRHRGRYKIPDVGTSRANPVTRGTPWCMHIRMRGRFRKLFECIS
eukprot:scaffold183_cov249-Pinguiococcus_pyrenoidosus.AAC.20